VALVRAGKQIKQVAYELGISAGCLHTWVRQDRIDRGELAGSPPPSPLVAVGIRGLSLNSVAARAGVAKRSISARWPEREMLILEGSTRSPPAWSRRTRVRCARTWACCEPDRRGDGGIAAVDLASCVAEFEDFPQYYEAFRRESVDRCMAAVEDVLHDAAQRGELRHGSTARSAPTASSPRWSGPGPSCTWPTASADQIGTQLVDVFARGLAAPTTQEESR
jgi:AcrR family transcriptional regulator